MMMAERKSQNETQYPQRVGAPDRYFFINYGQSCQQANKE